MKKEYAMKYTSISATIIFLSTFILLISIHLFSQTEKQNFPALDSIAVPEGNGKPVLLDGIFSQGEWDDALKLEIHPKVQMYLKKYKGHVFIGLRYLPSMGNGADLQISSDGKTIYHLHVSAQLGERLINENSGSFDNPSFIFGATSDWYANEIRSNLGLRDSLIKQGKSREEAIGISLYKYDGVEFQIRQSKINSDVWLIRFSTAFPPGQVGEKPTVIVYPENTKLTSTKGWLRLFLHE